MQTTAVELNPQVVATAHAWFDLPLPEDDARLRVVRADAGAWVARQRGEISALMVDLYDHEAQAPVLDTPQFYARCRRALEPGGAMTVNLFGGQSDLPRSLQRIGAAFEQVWLFEPTAEGNTVVVAVASPDAPDAPTLKLRAAAVAERTDLPARKWVRALRPLVR
ncbi:MAG: spermidine synthase, partial [Betaproteobacteria bacterium]|nr:spermidine synthase [Betaproteobacteria bacterium]